MNMLTREKIMEMGAGREMDALVAEKAMGWKQGVDFDLVEDYSKGVARYEPFSMDVRTFGPSTDIHAAWEAVEKYAECTVRKFETMGSGYRYVCRIDLNAEESVLAQGDTAPLAICKAVLLTTITGCGNGVVK